MSKRKPDKASKPARSPAVVTGAHEQKEDIVKSAKEDLLRSVGAGPIESPPALHDDPQEEALKIEKQATPNDEGQEAPKVENQEGPISYEPGATRRRSVARVWFCFSDGKHGELSNDASGNHTSQHAICF